MTKLLALIAEGVKMIVTLIESIIIGLIVGILARLAMPGSDRIGTLMMIIVGIVGALLGGFIILDALGFGSKGLLQFIIACVIGAVILLSCLSTFIRRVM